MVSRKPITPEQAAALHSRFTSATRWLNDMLAALSARGFDDTDLICVTTRQAVQAMEAVCAATLDPNAKIPPPAPTLPPDEMLPPDADPGERLFASMLDLGSSAPAQSPQPDGANSVHLGGSGEDSRQ